MDFLAVQRSGMGFLVVNLLAAFLIALDWSLSH